MSNVLDETKQQRLGWTLRRIEGAMGVRRETVSGYLKAAGVAVRGRGGRPAHWPPPNPATTGEVSTDSVDMAATTVATKQSRPAQALSVCEPYRDLVDDAIRRGRKAVAMWLDLVDRHGFAGRYASVRRFVRRVRGGLTPEPSGIVETVPGEEAQVDYGEGPMVRDPTSGKHRCTRFFVMTSAARANRCGCSRGTRAVSAGPSCMRRPFAASAGPCCASTPPVAPRTEWRRNCRGWGIR